MSSLDSASPSTLQQPEVLTDCLKSVVVQSELIAKSSTQLSSQIVQLENWLTQLPGRVPVTSWMNLPDPSQVIGLSLDRHGKEWRLSVAILLQDQLPPDEETHWKALRDASVEEKMYAIVMFPSLIAKLGEAQANLIMRLNAVNATFNGLATAIGINAKEGA